MSDNGHTRDWVRPSVVNYLLACLLASSMMVTALFLPRDAVFFFAGAFVAVGTAAGLWDMVSREPTVTDELTEQIATAARTRRAADGVTPASDRWRPPRRAA